MKYNEQRRRTLTYDTKGLHVILEETADGHWEWRIVVKSGPHDTTHQIVATVQTETEAHLMVDAITTIIADEAEKRRQHD